MNIKEFKKGDVITRVNPAIIDGGTDFSYIGAPLELIGIANGLIYFSDINKFSVSLPSYSYSENWDRYIDPETL